MSEPGPPKWGHQDIPDNDHTTIFIHYHVPITALFISVLLLSSSFYPPAPAAPAPARLSPSFSPAPAPAPDVTPALVSRLLLVPLS